VQHALAAAEDEEAGVDDDGDEDGGGDLGAVLGVLIAARHLVVLAAEQRADDAEDYDGEGRDYGAAMR
jgi:hypothetical protein